MTAALGIDLGGTKIEIIGLDEHGAELLRRRRPSPRGSYDATLATVRALVIEAEATVGPGATVGIGTPGAISPATGLLKNSNSTWLNGRPLDRDLAAALERPVEIANDADCLALSEATDGAAAGAATVFAAILGTGVGGGLALHGEVLAGPNAIAGEWGHNPLPWPRPEEQPGPAGDRTWWRSVAGRAPVYRGAGDLGALRVLGRGPDAAARGRPRRLLGGARRRLARPRPQARGTAYGPSGANVTSRHQPKACVRRRARRRGSVSAAAGPPDPRRAQPPCDGFWSACSNSEARAFRSGALN